MQEQRSQGAKPDAGATAEHGSKYEENEQELLCVCQQPYNVDTAMVSCDMCEDWYHLRCVGITQTAAKSMKKYVCPVCTALKGNAEPLDAALAKVPHSQPVFCCENRNNQGIVAICRILSLHPPRLLIAWTVCNGSNASCLVLLGGCDNPCVASILHWSQAS